MAKHTHTNPSADLDRLRRSWSFVHESDGFCASSFDLKFFLHFKKGSVENTTMPKELITSFKNIGQTNKNNAFWIPSGRLIFIGWLKVLHVGFAELGTALIQLRSPNKPDNKPFWCKTISIILFFYIFERLNYFFPLGSSPSESCGLRLRILSAVWSGT